MSSVRAPGAQRLRTCGILPPARRSATLNLNGDYLSDALAAQVGGIGIAPGVRALSRVDLVKHSLAAEHALAAQGNINYKTGHAIFEATHGTAPK